MGRYLCSPVTSVAMLLAHAHHLELDHAPALAALKQVAEVVKGWRQFSSVRLPHVDEKHRQSAFEHERLEEALRIAA